MRIPENQADGLRRLFAAAPMHWLPVAANPHVAFGGMVLDRLAGWLARHGRRVLVVDAGAQAPAAPELALVDLASCVEPIAPAVDYLPARGLPLHFVDTRGSAAAFVDAVARAAPAADALVLHLDAADLARVLRRRAARPLLLAADHPDSLKHAYASCKLLVQRAGLMTFDLALAAPRRSPRLHAIGDSLAGCTDRFLGAVVRHRVAIDPAAPHGDAAAAADEDAELSRLLAAQLALDEPEIPADRWPAAAAAGWPAGPAGPHRIAF